MRDHGSTPNTPHPNTAQQAPRHQITVCLACRHTGDACRPGQALIEKLRAAIAAAGPALAADFAVSGVACMAGCARPCTVAYHGTAKATYLFGDIDPAEDIGALLAFAEQYRGLADGWCSASNRPEGLSGKTLARVPAALLVAETVAGQIQ